MDIYAIGNALIDTVIQDSSKLIQQLELDKGSMTLIDEQQLSKINTFVQPYITKQSAGGSAANTIFTAQLLGAKCHLSCKVGDDENGSIFINELNQTNISHNYLSKQPTKEISGSCLVFITPDAERTMCTFLGASATISPEDVNEEKINAAKICYVEGYLVSSPTGQQSAIRAFEYASQHNKKMGFTFSDINMIKFFKPQIEELLHFTPHYLFCNEQEALAYCDTSDLETAKEKLRHVAHTVIITKGSEGAEIIEGSNIIKVPSVPATAIDTNGAGDTFAGAFLAAAVAGKSLEDCGELAAKAGAQIVSIEGPRLTLENIHSITI